MPWWNAYDELQGRVIEGDGFSVKRYLYGHAVRYILGDRHITLPAEEVDQTDELGRTYWIFRRYCVLVTVPSILKWDGGSELTRKESEKIKEGISWALKRIGSRHQYVVDDDFEERMTEMEAELKRKYGTEDPWSKPRK